MSWYDTNKHARKWEIKTQENFGSLLTTLVTFLGIQWAVASRISCPKRKVKCISTKKQAQCESGNGCQVWLALKTVRLWLVLKDETWKPTHAMAKQLFISHIFPQPSD